MSLLKSLMAKQAGVKDESQAKTPSPSAQVAASAEKSGSNPVQGEGKHSALAAGDIHGQDGTGLDSSRRDDSHASNVGGVGDATQPVTDAKDSASASESGSTRASIAAIAKAEVNNAQKAGGSLLAGLSAAKAQTGSASQSASVDSGALAKAGTTSVVPATTQATNGTTAQEGAKTPGLLGTLASKPTGLLSGIAASRERAEKAKQDHSYLYDEIPKDFGETLKRFDQLMQRDQGDIDIDLPHMRDYVSRIMVDLKTNPEYNDLVHDGDVHNIIKFIRRTQSEARAIINQKIDKRARSESKPKAKNRFAMDLSSLDLGASPSDKPKSIQDLSDIDF